MFGRVSLIVRNGLRTASVNATRHLAAATKSKEKWDLYAGVVVERLPVVSRTLSPLEHEFQEYLWRVEFENSLKSNHEMQHERDILQMELLKKGEIELDIDETASKQTAQDLVDAYTDELSKFQFASRVTADDKANNLTSTNRSFEDTLYLLVEEKLGNKDFFMLPQGPRIEGETMRQAAERILREKCGDKMQVLFYGHAPCGFYKYKYPAAMREQSVGAKVFFYRASLRSGNVDKSKAKNFEWLTKEALNDKLSNASYAESIQKLLF